MLAVFVRAAGDWAEVLDLSSVFGQKTKQIAQAMPRIVTDVFNPFLSEFSVGSLSEEEVVVSFEKTIVLTANHPCIWITIEPMYREWLDTIGYKEKLLRLIKDEIIDLGLAVQFQNLSFTPSMDIELLFRQGVGGSINEEDGSFKATW